MHVGGHWAVCWESLQTIMERERAQEFILAGSLWDRLFELSHMPSYREILIEVLSSFEFRPRRVDQLMDRRIPSLEVCFHLASQARAMSLSEFATRCGLY
ncbi:hypothetical protein Hanom_Chr06g00538811 [Helianthus anomalus]